MAAYHFQSMAYVTCTVAILICRTPNAGAAHLPRAEHTGHAAWATLNLEGAAATTAPAHSSSSLAPLGTALSTCIAWDKWSGLLLRLQRTLGFLCAHPKSVCTHSSSTAGPEHLHHCHYDHKVVRTIAFRGYNACWGWSARIIRA